MEKHIHMTLTPLKRLLFERGIKNRWLAEQCEINEANLGLVINGKRLPSIKSALKIAQVLNTTVEELWGYLLDENEEPTDGGPKE